MKLTDKEMEIMALLWNSTISMTAAEIVDASHSRTWKENSIYVIMNTLIKKGVVEMALHKPTSTNNARAYKPMITPEEYAASYIARVRRVGIPINNEVLVKHFSEKKEI